ncbi:tetratricopeptide repeat protein [Streptomyces sp. NPDC102264]|uniref:tetratricopeptide repeat protein n=1 Tax=Streptomyces sp. NPDC102264 TaxID=3366149 RepID=UPI00382407F1
MVPLPNVPVSHWDEVFTLGAAASAALGDLEQQATQLNYLAWVHSVPPRHPQTMLRYGTEAFELATRSNATAQIAWSHHYSGAALRMLGRLDEAITSASRAAEMFRTMGDSDSYVQSLTNIGNCLRDQGRYEEALRQFLQLRALIDDEGSGMTPNIAAHSRPVALIRIGECLAHLGRRTEAITTLGEAIGLLDELQVANFWPAEALKELAALLAEEGRTGESRRTYARAAEVFESIGDTEAGSRCHALATAAS